MQNLTSTFVCSRWDSSHFFFCLYQLPLVGTPWIFHVFWGVGNFFYLTIAFSYSEFKSYHDFFVFFVFLLCHVKFVFNIYLQPYQNTFLPIKNKRNNLKFMLIWGYCHTNFALLNLKYIIKIKNTANFILNLKGKIHRKILVTSKFQEDVIAKIKMYKILYVKRE